MVDITPLSFWQLRRFSVTAWTSLSAMWSTLPLRELNVG
jgi:hypothetical protein